MLIKPWSTRYADVYLLTAAWSHAYAEFHDGALRLEYELNATYNFGDQDHWELNVTPISLRWRRFPWNDRACTTAPRPGAPWALRTAA